MPEQSILDARLAEIDRRLRTIQSGLTPPEATPPVAVPASAPVAVPEPPVRPDPARASGPPPASEPPPPPPPSVSRISSAGAPGLAQELLQVGQLIAELRRLTAEHERLLASSRELLSAFAGAIARRPDAERPAPDAPGAGSIGLTAGPFADTGAVRRFQRSLATLPDVRDVFVREYAGEDRVVVDVHLSGAPKS